MSPAVATILVYSINSISTSQSFSASKTLTHTTILDRNCGNTCINKSKSQHHHHRCHISLPSLPSLSSLLSLFFTISTQTFETDFSTDPKLTESYNIITGNKLFTKAAITLRSILRNTNGTHKWMRPKLQQVHQSDYWSSLDILWRVAPTHSAENEKITNYFTRLTDYHVQPIRVPNDDHGTTTADHRSNSSNLGTYYRIWKRTPNMLKVTASSNTKSTSKGRKRKGGREMEKEKEKEKQTKSTRKRTHHYTYYYASEYTSKQTYSYYVKQTYSYHIKHF